MPQRCLEQGLARAVNCRNGEQGHASALSSTQHPYPQPNGSNLLHLIPASWPGDSLIRPRCARLLAKPEYSSPPGEVCCWPRRLGEDAGRVHRGGSVAQGAKEVLLAGTPWWLSCCWPGDATEQDAAGRDAVAQLNTIRGNRCASNVERACSSAARRSTEAAVRTGKKLASGSSRAHRGETACRWQKNTHLQW